MSAGRRRARVGLAGFGTVGRAVARLVQDSPDLELVGILNRQVERKRVPWIEAGVRWTESFDELLADDLDVFVELVGGRDLAPWWIRRALERGISVVTANKQVVAHHGVPLLQSAAQRGAHLRFEGAVAGGVPVIRAIESGLAGDQLTRVEGVLNGTCNYILTRIEREGATFADALREAQALGYAEADPTEDVDGIDARAKIAILAMVALGVQAPPDDIGARSICGIEPVDFAYARRFGCTIRQVAWAERTPGGGLRAAVGPALVPFGSPLGAVSASENLVRIEGRLGGATSFGGRGAGGEPTAVAVLSDVLTIARGSAPAVRALPAPATEVSGELHAPYYVRLRVIDRPGIIASLASAFARHQISIDAILQEPGFPAAARPFVIALEPAWSGAVESALCEIARLDFHVHPVLAMPMLAPAASMAVSA